MSQRIGFIGLGIMGRPMAENLLKSGFSLSVHNRTRSKEKPLADAGANVAASPAEVAVRSDIVPMWKRCSSDRVAFKKRHGPIFS
jgi:3-hydroxyisobutyrate dehydrogenase-like beta-hydroxyacid dehydrogenase